MHWFILKIKNSEENYTTVVQQCAKDTNQSVFNECENAKSSV